MSNPTVNRTDRFVKNIIGSAILQIVTVVTGFISPRLMLTAFGSEINGITSSIMQFISYLTLVEAGLSNATVFALYKPLADGDIKARDSVISAAKISYYRIGLLFVGLSVALAAVYPFIGEQSSLSYLEMFALVLVLCCNSTFNFFILAKYRTLLTADQCGYAVSLSNSIQLIVHLIIVYVTINLGMSVVWVRGLGILSFFVTSAVLAIYTRHKYGKINYKAEPNMKALDKRWDAMGLQIMGVVATGAPVVIMTAILDYKQISVYSIYNMIAGSVATCISVFTNGLSAGFGNIYAIGDSKLLKKTTEEFRTAFYILITIVYTVMLTCLLSFVRLYTDGINDVNYIVPVFAVLITIKGLLDNFKAPHGMLIYSFGKFKVIKRQTAIQTVLILVSTIVLTWWLGLNGAMLALCIANLYMLVELLILSPKELVDMSIAKNVRQIIQILVIVFGVYGLSLAIGYQPTSYLAWVLYAFIVGVVSVIITVVAFLIFDHDDTVSVWKRMLAFVKRRKKNS